VEPELTMFVIGSAVLLSYWFIHLAGRYHVPSVVLLLLTGIVARATTHFFHNSVVFPPQLLPVLGTCGLVLIVLEGALDLRLEPGRRSFLLRTFSSAALGVASTTLALAVAIEYLLGVPMLQALLLAAPFGVISSSVAIPTAETLQGEDREFVIYESSWSDIFGVMLFNALVVALNGGAFTINLLGGSFAIAIVGVAIGLGYYWLVGHLEGHVKFVPLLFALILVYVAADSLHLSPLLIVLILGLMLNNAHLLRRVPAFDRLHSSHFHAELGKLKHLTAEATFLVRTFFFLLLGYVTDVRTFLNPLAWGYAACIVAAIFVLRWLVLRACTSSPGKLNWMAPRGLVTVTLFFSMPAGSVPQIFPHGTLILVVLLSCIIMTLGLKFTKGSLAADSPHPQSK
jgi:potassium/hydrogen antiporter